MGCQPPLAEESSIDFVSLEKWIGYGSPDARMWAVGLEEHCMLCQLGARLHLMSDDSVSPNRGLEEFHALLRDRLEVGTECRRDIEKVLEDWTRVSVWRVASELFDAIYQQPRRDGDWPDSHILFAELLPLPLPSRDRANDWPDEYGSAKEYRNLDYIRLRGQRLVDLAAHHNPEVVVLHGKTDHRKWAAPTLGTPDDEVVIGTGRFDTASFWSRGRTLWVLTSNLVNNRNVHWSAESIVALGDEIRRRLLP